MSVYYPNVCVCVLVDWYADTSSSMLPYKLSLFFLQNQEPYPWSRPWLPTSPHPRAVGVPASLQRVTGVLQTEDRPVWRGTWGASADAGEVQGHLGGPGQTQLGVVNDIAFLVWQNRFVSTSLHPEYPLSISYSGRYGSGRERLWSCKTLWVTCRSIFSKRENSLCGFMQKMTD